MSTRGYRPERAAAPSAAARKSTCPPEVLATPMSRMNCQNPWYQAQLSPVDPSTGQCSRARRCASGALSASGSSGAGRAIGYLGDEVLVLAAGTARDLRAVGECQPQAPRQAGKYMPAQAVLLIRRERDRGYQAGFDQVEFLLDELVLQQGRNLAEGPGPERRPVACARSQPQHVAHPSHDPREHRQPASARARRSDLGVIPEDVAHQRHGEVVQRGDGNPADRAGRAGIAGVVQHLDEQTLGLSMVMPRSEEHTSELQSQSNLVCRLLLEKKKPTRPRTMTMSQQS